MNPGAAPTVRKAGAARPLPEGARRSHALEHFTGVLTRSEPMQVLDLGGIQQGTLDFVTNLGHRLYAEDLLRAAGAAFTREQLESGGLEERAVEEFLAQSIPFPNGAAGGALMWDRFHFLPAPLAQAVAARLYRVLRPGAALLAIFHPEAAKAQPSACVCRIVDEQHLLMTPRGEPRRTQPFTPRSIERFFHQFQSVKFFMTRESVQEVIVRR